MCWISCLLFVHPPLSFCRLRLLLIHKEVGLKYSPWLCLWPGPDLVWYLASSPTSRLCQASSWNFQAIRAWGQLMWCSQSNTWHRGRMRPSYVTEIKRPCSCSGNLGNSLDKSTSAGSTSLFEHYGETETWWKFYSPPWVRKTSPWSLLRQGRRRQPGRAPAHKHRSLECDRQL
jgi:hypothetical protein